MKKLLMILPHCSTGGMPQFALKKIELLIHEYEIYVIEYSRISDTFIVQYNAINTILQNKIITLSNDKYELIRIIDEINPNVIHLEEIPEYFMKSEIADIIYSQKRTYTIIETTHDSTFDIREKKYFPDEFLFVSEYSIKQFAPLNIKSTLIEYPIEYKIRPDRDKTLKSLHLDPQKIHILNVGLFTSRKNQAEIIEYAKQLKDTNIVFHFVGNMADNFRDYWQPLVDNLPDNCVLWGEQSNTDIFYSCMDTFLFTSRGNINDMETNPLVIKEAISWNMKILLYSLPVYLGKYDSYENVHYLSDSFSYNIELIKNSAYSTLDIMKLTKKYRIIDNQNNEYINENICAVNKLYGLNQLLIENTKDKNFDIAVEIGCFAGSSSELISKYTTNKLYCIDMWNEYIFPESRAKMAEDCFDNITKLNSNIIKIKDNSNNYVDKIHDNSIDFLYIDADHEYESVLSDITKWLPKVKTTGVIAGHDYHMSGVARAVTEVFSNKPKIYSDGSWSIKKSDVFVHFSIIIPTYKRNHLLDEAINSVLNQNYPSVDIFVCHDGPDSDYDNYVSSNNYNVWFMQTDENSNNLGATPRNILIDHVDKNSFVFFLDDDNILYENVLHKLNSFISKDSSMIINDILLDGFGWYNLKLPDGHRIVHAQIDMLNLCIKAEILHNSNIKFDNDFGNDYRFIADCQTYCENNNLKVEFSDICIGKHRCIQDNPIFIFSHNYLVNNWSEIVQEEIDAIKSSKLIDSVEKIFFYAYGDDDSFNKFKKIILSTFDYNKFDIHRHQENNYEFDTLNELHKFALSQYNNGKILYIHTKGVTSGSVNEHNSIAINEWKNDLIRYNITYWQEATEKLDNFDAYGAYLFMGEYGRSNIFAGNFWWSNINYIKTLPKLSYTDRGECETWLFSNNPSIYNTYTPPNKNLYFNMPRNEVVIISAHPNYTKSIEITKKCLIAINNSGRDTILVSHWPVPLELQELCTYYIYDKNNPFIEHDFFAKSWNSSDEYYAEIDIRKYGNNMNHAPAVHNNYYNGINLAFSKEYEIAHCINFDIIIDELDYSVLDFIGERLSNEFHKIGYFMYSPEIEGETYKTIYFACKPEQFLNIFRYFKDINEYKYFINEIGSNTNCLENVYYHTLNKYEKNLIIENTNEIELFKHSEVNLFSMIEYFTVLKESYAKNTDNIESTVIFFSSQNQVDDRICTLECHNVTDNEYLFSETKHITDNFVFYIKFMRNLDKKYNVRCKIYNDNFDLLKCSDIEILPNENISDNGLFIIKSQLFDINNFEIKLDDDNHIIFTYNNPTLLKDTNITINICDLDSDLPLYSFDIDLLNGEHWAIPYTGEYYEKYKERFAGYKFYIYNTHNELLAETEIRLRDSLYNNKYVYEKSDTVIDSYIDFMYNDIYGKFIENINSVLDVGANIGTFIEYIKHKNPNINKIVALEPNKKCYNYAIQNFSEATIINKALHTDSNGVTLHIINNNSTSTSIMQLNNSEEIFVESTTLKDILIKFDNFDLLKMNIEGAEYDIFDNTYGYLLEKFNKIIVEYHYSDTLDINLIVNKLVDIGFVISDDPNFSYIGLKNIQINGRIYAKKLKIRAVHLQTIPTDEREIKSRKSIERLSNYDIEYVNIVNKPYTELPPIHNCARPDDIQMEPGEYKLTPAHYGNWLAHSDAIIKYLTDDIDCLLIFECDANIEISIEEFVKKIRDSYETTIRYDLLMWSYGQNYGYNIEKYNRFSIVDHFVECHAYMIPLKSKTTFLRTFNVCRWDVIDLFYINEFSGIPQGVFNDILCKQIAGYSLLDKRVSDANILGELKTKN